MLRTKITVEEFNAQGNKELHVCDLHYDDGNLVSPSDRTAQAYLLDKWGYVAEKDYLDLQDDMAACLDNEEQDVGQDDGWQYYQPINRIPCGIYEVKGDSVGETPYVVITKSDHGSKYIYSAAWKSGSPMSLNTFAESDIRFKTVKEFQDVDQD